MPAPPPVVKADGEADGGQQGVKRAREESDVDDDDEGQPMEEESDVEMEASSEESE